MACRKINVHSLRLIIFGLIFNVSASKEYTPSQIWTNPPITSSSDNVSSMTVTSVSSNTTMDRKQKIIYNIGKNLCPYNDYCSRQKEFLPFPDHPCCEDCSCEDSCWETKNCCPDKEVIDTRMPVENCHVTIVKKRNKNMLYNGLYFGIKAYRIVDNCPESEQNVSIINRCTLLDINHISDYNWVSNFSTGTIYQNKFCAACHGETGLTEWLMEARCEDVLYSNFSDLKSLLLSEKCDLINREPSGIADHPYIQCAVPFYSRCNQTGLWEIYDQDIEWACNIHEATFLEVEFNHIDVYKNAFCYACNRREIASATAICKIDIRTIRTDFSLVFSTLIDYRRDDYLESYQPASDFACEVNEMFDPYLPKCRSLICPFASVSFYGKCEQLVEHTFGLSVEVIYTLTALWSNIDILFTDEITTFEILGNQLLRKLQDDAFQLETQCRYCYQYLRLLKGIKKSSNSHSESNINTGNTTYTDSNLLFYTIWLTDEDCDLQRLIKHALELAGSSIQMEENGNRYMSFKVELLKENRHTMITSGKLIAERNRYRECYVMYKLTTEVICPKIRISFSEFEPFMTDHNAEIIKSMFTTTQVRSKEYKEICVADYFEKLGDRTFKFIQNRGSFQPRTKRIIFLTTMVITEFVRMLTQ